MEACRWAFQAQEREALTVFFCPKTAQIGKLLWAAIAILPLVCVAQFHALAQSYPVHQAGHATRGHMAMWMNNGLLGDAGGALNGQIQALGIVPLPLNPLPPFCINDSFVSNPAGFHEVCITANAFGGGGELTYGPISGASNAPFTMQSANVLAITSGAQQVAFSNLPPTAAGDVPVCINSVTGQLYQASASEQDIPLTDDTGSYYLTDDSGSNYLVSIIPGGSCAQQ